MLWQNWLLEGFRLFSSPSQKFLLLRCPTDESQKLLKDKAADRFHLFLQTCWVLVFYFLGAYPWRALKLRFFFNTSMESLRELRDPFTPNDSSTQLILFSASQPSPVRRALSPRYFIYYGLSGDFGALPNCTSSACDGYKKRTGKCPYA